LPENGTLEIGDSCLMPRPQKSIDVTIDLSQELKDIGFRELRIKDENGIIKLEDGNPIWFPFYIKNYGKSIEKIQESLMVRKMDERVVKVACIKITDVLVKCDFYNGHAAGSGGNGKSKEEQDPGQETQALIDGINVLIEKYKDIPYGVWELERAKRYQALRQTVNDNIPDAWESIEFVLTGKGILHIRDITLPFIGIILGNPSTYKTLAIGMLRKWYDAYYVDKISPKSFVSHANVENKDELEDIDLVQKIKDKLLLIPELSPIFMTSEEILVDILSTFVRLADGEGLLIHSGLHGRRGIDGKLMFSMIGASVEIPSRIYKVLSSLGPKLYFYRTNFKEPDKKLLQDEIAGKDFEVKYQEIKCAFFDYLRWLEVCPLMMTLAVNNKNSIDCSSITADCDDDNNSRRVIEWDKAKDDQKAIELISEIAIFLSKIRGNTYAYETRSGARLSSKEDDSVTESVSYEYVYDQPIFENPSRANAVLYNITRAHAFEIHGRNYIAKEDIPIIIKIALSTANRNRVSVIKLLLTTKNSEKDGKHIRKLHTSDLVEKLNVSRPTAHRAMKELQILGLVRISTDRVTSENYIEITEKFQWLLEEEFQDLIQGFDWGQVIIKQQDEDEEIIIDEDTINKSIYRSYPHSDIWACKNCKLKGDLRFMQVHDCSGSSKDEDPQHQQKDKGQKTL
jgi:DNA-binding MarR family transcriptional regulator